MANENIWENLAREKQQVYYEVFGDRDWDSYKASELQYFRRNIGHAIYGPPDEEPNEETNLGTGYNPDKLQHIKQVCATIQQQDIHVAKASDEIRVSVVYVIMKLQFENYTHVPSPVFRVPKIGNTDDTNNVFIDSNCRVYMGWASYLKKNKLPQCTYCYPRNGVYYGDASDQVIVDFSVTPAGTLTHRVLNGVDTLGTAVSVGATLVTLAAFAVPVTGSVMLATTVSGAVVGAYGAGRSVESIVDRKKHQQTIGLKDAESRNSWISLIANSLGLAAAGASKTVSVMASRGSVVGKTGCFVVNAAQISSIAANGIGIVNGFFVLREKSKTGDLTCLEVFQFSSSILFFTNSVVNLKTAKTIIRETQQNVIQEFETNLRSNRHRKAYQRMARNTREGLDAMNGDAKVIKSIKNISNPDDFFSGIVRVQKQFPPSEAQLSFTENGHVDINKQLQVDPSKFAAIDKVQRQIIVTASKQFADGTLDRHQYEATVNPIYLNHGLETTQQRLEAVTAIVPNSDAIANNLMDMDVGGNHIFANLQPTDMQRIVAVVRKTFAPDILYIAVKLAQALNFYGTADFIKFLEFSSGFIDQILSEMEYAYFEVLSAARYRGDFNQDQFDVEYGIQGDRRQHFLNGILKIYSIGQKCIHMRDAYERYKTTQTQLEEPQSSNNHVYNSLAISGSSLGTSSGNVGTNSTYMDHSGMEPTNSACTENREQDAEMSTTVNISRAWAELQLPGMQCRNNQIIPDKNQAHSGISRESNVKLSRTWDDMELSESSSTSSAETSLRPSKHFKPSSASASTTITPTMEVAEINAYYDVNAAAATILETEGHLDLDASADVPTDEAPEGNHVPQLRVDRDFSATGLLTVEEHYHIAQLLTGVEANKYNSYVEHYDDLMALVVIMDHVKPQRVVLITSDVAEKKVTANELV